MLSGYVISLAIGCACFTLQGCQEEQPAPAGCWTTKSDKGVAEAYLAPEASSSPAATGLSAEALSYTLNAVRCNGKEQKLQAGFIKLPTMRCEDPKTFFRANILAADVCERGGAAGLKSPPSVVYTSPDETVMLVAHFTKGSDNQWVHNPKDTCIVDVRDVGYLKLSTKKKLLTCMSQNTKAAMASLATSTQYVLPTKDISAEAPTLDCPSTLPDAEEWTEYMSCVCKKGADVAACKGKIPVSEEPEDV